MIDTAVFSSPIIIILVVFCSLVHIASAIPTALGIQGKLKNVLFYVTLGVCITAHIALIVTALILKATAEELFLSLMISAAVGMLSVYFSERIVARHTSRGEIDKEGGNGI